MAITFLDIVRHNAADPVVGIIEESIQAHPEMQVLSSRTIVGTGFDSLVRVTMPGVGFRNLNEGNAAVKSEWALRRSSTFLVDASAEVDLAADAQLEDGIEAFLAIQTGDMLEAAMRSISSQIWYGTATTVATSTALRPTIGFPGMIETYDSTNMEVNAGGGGATRSSVWFVKTNPKNVQLLLGRGGEIAAGETMQVRLTDGGGDPYDGLRKPLTFWIGLHNANPRNSAVRIRNLTAAAPLTDALMYSALQLFPSGVIPDAIFMSRRSLFQLRTSRTATNPTGAPAPLVDSWEGIPVHVTDAIVDTEAA